MVFDVSKTWGAARDRKGMDALQIGEEAEKVTDLCTEAAGECRSVVATAGARIFADISTRLVFPKVPNQ